MDKIYKNKYALLILIFLFLGIVFNYFLTLQIELISNGFYWLKTFALMLLFFYFSFVFSTLIQITFLFILRIFPIKVFSIYPFTFDGKLRFRPLRLIYNIEGFTNSLIINLSYYVNNENLLLKKMKQFLLLRKISTFISYFILFLFLNNINMKTIIVVVVAYLGTVLISYFKYGTFWYGYDFIYHSGSNELIEYLYSTKSIMFFNGNEYAKFYNKIENENNLLELSVLENYLYRCILERETIIDANILEQNMMKYHNPDKVLTYDLNFDAKRINILKLIGWVGIVCNNRDYVQCSINLLFSIYTDVVNNSLPVFIKHGTKRIKEEINILKHEQNGTSCPIKLQDMQCIFSIYDKLF